MRDLFKSLFRKATWIGGLFAVIDWFVGVLAGVFAFAGKPLSKVFMKIPGMSSIPKFGELFTENFDHIEKLKLYYKNSDEPLLNGDLEQAAREAFPPEDHPEMWVEWRSDMNP